MLTAVEERSIRRPTVDGFLVQEMVSGVEMIVGGRSDPLFGPVIVAGFGGVTAELLKDVSIRLAPIDDEHRARHAGKSSRAPHCSINFVVERPATWMRSCTPSPRCRSFTRQP